MKLRPRTLPAVLLAATLGLLSLNCGGGKGGGVTVVMWEFFPQEAIRPLITRFEAANPGVHVELQQLTWQGGLEKISAAVAAGTVPDLCEIGSTWEARFAASGALRDWSRDVAPIRAQHRLWEAVQFGDSVYGVPWVMGTRALFYNKELFARAGLDSSRAPETWDEVEAGARKIRALGAQTYGFGLQGGERYKLFKKFMSLAWSNGGTILSADGKSVTFNSPQNLAALRFYMALRAHSIMDRQEVLDQAFEEGRIGMQISGAWLLKKIPNDAPSLKYGVGLIPAPKGGVHASFAGAEILASFKASKHPAEALALALFLMRADNAAELCRVAKDVQPSAVGSEDDPYYAAHPMERLFVEQLKTAVAPPNIPQWVEMERVIEESLEAALLGKSTPEAALAEAHKQLEALLAAPAAAS